MAWTVKPAPSQGSDPTCKFCRLLTHISPAFIVLVGILDTLPVKLVLTRLRTLQDVLSVGATNVGAVENNVLHAIGCATSSVP